MKETIQFLENFAFKLGERILKAETISEASETNIQLHKISFALEVLKEELEAEIQLQKLCETIEKNSSGNCDCLFEPKPYFEDLITKEKRCNYCLKKI